MITIIIADPAQTEFVVPDDWNNDDNIVRCIGAGAGGKTATLCGGGGGAYAEASMLAFAPGESVPLHVGVAGTTNANGDHTWFGAPDFAPDFASASVAAKGGKVDTDSTGGAGGAATESIGALCHMGGKGGKKKGNPVSGPVHGGGGGAAGPNGAGGDAPVAPTGGSADGGAAATDGSTWTDGVRAAGPGGGANGRTSSGGVQGAPAGKFGGGGAPTQPASGGLIVIEYTPAA